MWRVLEIYGPVTALITYGLVIVGCALWYWLFSSYHKERRGLLPLAIGTVSLILTLLLVFCPPILDWFISIPPESLLSRLIDVSAIVLIVGGIMGSLLIFLFGKRVP
ncbi:MAG: hypothetical protein M1136_12395 [Chloroflexi bacterium]|nr:hypothetical protein [Chloroflexota bacterium]MCL5076424.1 hypothetical protein [Chloroflexota bacterium]